MDGKKVPKKQHYVPKHYLRLFCDGKERLWVYNKRNGKIYQSNVDDVGSSNHTYETSWVDAPNDERFLIPGHIETETLHDIEAAQAPVLREVVRKLNLAILPCASSLALVDEEREAVLAFFAITLCRNPLTMEAFRPSTTDAEPISELLPYKNLVEEMKLGDFVSFEEHGLKTMLTKFGEGSIPSLVLEGIRGMHLSFAVAEPGSGFVTSTQPVFYQQSGEDDALSYLSMPLTPRFTACLSTGSRASAMADMPCEGVEQLNFMYADPRHDQVEAVVSANRGILERLRRRAEEEKNLPLKPSKIIVRPRF